MLTIAIHNGCRFHIHNHSEVKSEEYLLLKQSHIHENSIATSQTISIKQPN